MTSAVGNRIRAGAFAGALALASATALWAGSAAARDGDVRRGGELANRWCTSCHLIDAKGTGTAADQAPPFTVAARKTPEALRAWLTGPHVAMPELDLGRREVDDLIAYIRSLDTKR